MKIIFALLLTTVFATQAHSATVLLSGINFDVKYDDSQLGPYGTPTLSGNTIFFTPTNFYAESLNGLGIATSRGTTNIQILAKNGFEVGALNLQERGDYLLRGANSFVGVSGQTRAFAINNPLFDISAAIVSSTPLTLQDGVQHNWVASSSLNLANLGLNANQAVNYTIENLLEAYTDPSDIGARRAFIEKKFSGFSVLVSPVPEPNTVITLMAGFGLIGLVLARRKKETS
jgi:PEP-CTERM motif